LIYDLSGQRIFKTESLYDTEFTAGQPHAGQAGALSSNTAGVYYQYDQNGNLLFQQPIGGVSTGLLEREAATHYYWLPTPQGDILVGFDQGINSYAVYTDHLGTPRLVTKIDNPQNPKPITDTSNDLPQADYGQPEGISPLAIPVWQWSYSPFGADLANGYEAQPTSIQDNFKPVLWAWMGLPETGGADQNQVAQETWRVQANLQIPPVLNIRYPGQYYDFESGLVQNWWRTYEPRIGRYTSADPIGLNGGWNRFAYVEGNPLSYIDPSGLTQADIDNAFRTAQTMTPNWHHPARVKESLQNLRLICDHIGHEANQPIASL
jgi:RHS repeat-associated protein